MSKTGISVHFPSPNLPTSSDKCNRLEGCLRDSDCKPSAALLPSRASGTPSKEQFRSDTIDTWQPFPLDMLVSLRRNIMDPEMNRLSRTILKYYRKQSRWVDELIEVDRLLCTTPTITKAPPLPSGSNAKETEREPLFCRCEHGAAFEQDSNANATRIAERPDVLQENENSETRSDSFELAFLPSASLTVDKGSVSIRDPASTSSFATADEFLEMPTSSLRESINTSARPDATIQAQGCNDMEKNVKQFRNNADRQSLIATRVAKLLLCINMVLFGFKLTAVMLSSSLAVVAVLVDNAVDMASGFVVWMSNVAIRKRNIYYYPQGRKRLEPVGIVILSAIMAVSSGQVILESLRKLVQMITENAPGPVMTWIPISLLIGDFIAKTTLYVVLFRFRNGNQSIQALQMDMRNDMISNVASLFSGLVAYHFLKYVDPAVAILIAVYIAFSWSRQLLRQSRMLTGYTAPKEFLNTLTWIAASHDPRILEVDTVRAFHAGVEYFVEVDVVLPADMILKETHDIGESLQQKIELLPNVARAFVHLDYDSQHDPEIEHKVS